MDVKTIETCLKQSGYVPNMNILYSVKAAINNNAPLIVEGSPGVGKTSLAKSVAKATGTKLIRVQFYDGLSAEKILYDYDYQRMLLSIESIKSVLKKNMEGMDISSALTKAAGVNFYSEDFLIERPILKAISGKEKYTLLLDELDKGSEEIEYTLLEVMDEFSMTIPQLGKTIVCPEEKRPIVIITSNNYRELSDAMRRRCAYLYIPKKTKEEMIEILLMKAYADELTCKNVAECIEKLQSMNLKQEPSIAEAIDWANFISENQDNNTFNIDNTLCMLSKNDSDRNTILKSGALNKFRR